MRIQFAALDPSLAARAFMRHAGAIAPFLIVKPFYCAGARRNVVVVLCVCWQRVRRSYAVAFRYRPLCMQRLLLLLMMMSLTWDYRVIITLTKVRRGGEAPYQSVTRCRSHKDACAVGLLNCIGLRIGTKGLCDDTFQQTTVQQCTMPGRKFAENERE